MTIKKLFTAAALLCLAMTPAAMAGNADGLWLHVKVAEGDETRVTVNLPLSLVEAALPMIPDTHFHHHGRVDLGDVDVTTDELRNLWRQIKASPDMTFVTVEDRGDTVRVWKEGDYLYVNAQDGSDDVDVRLPTVVIDALLSGDGHDLNVYAAIEALVDEGEGELVTVSGDDESVRVWVDRIAEAE